MPIEWDHAVTPEESALGDQMIRILSATGASKGLSEIVAMLVVATGRHVGEIEDLERRVTELENPDGK